MKHSSQGSGEGGDYVLLSSQRRKQNGWKIEKLTYIREGDRGTSCLTASVFLMKRTRFHFLDWKLSARVRTSVKRWNFRIAVQGGWKERKKIMLLGIAIKNQGINILESLGSIVIYCLWHHGQVTFHLYASTSSFIR